MSNKKYTVTNAQMERIKKRYEKLMYAIGYRIGGDRILYSLEDSVQELRISACDACEAYGRKMNMEFDEFFDTEEFDKYIKSTLWNRKNNAGKGIQKKWHINNSMAIDDEILEAAAPSVMDFPDVSAVLMECSLEPEEQDVLNTIMSDFSNIKPNGTINLSSLSRILGKEKKEVKKTIVKLQSLFKDYNEEL